MKKIIFLFLTIYYYPIFALSYSVCFTPPQQCGDKIVQAINTAKDSIYIQAYGFTSKKIINALIDASSRSVKIFILLDRSNFSTKKSNTINTLKQHSIKVYQDKINGIAHNKVMIIDRSTIITGSFNFTENADKRNAENVIIISDITIAELYLNNWFYRKSNH